jgi:hypothetical protein
MASKVKAEITSATRCWAKHIRSTDAFCFTVTEPTLAWTPGLKDDSIAQYVDMGERRKQVLLFTYYC